MRKDGDRKQILAQIEAIQANLDKGTFVVKEGHRVQGISDGGQELELPLMGGMRVNKIFELRRLLQVLKTGHSARKNYPEDK